jgi:hypothetical protein
MENLLPDTDQLAPKKADTAPAPARTLADWERELHACMKAVYGCSLAEYGYKAMAHGLAWGFELGKQEEAAKRKPHGRPCEMDVRELNALIHIVDTRSEQTIMEAVYDFLFERRLDQRFLTWVKSLNDDELHLYDPLPDHIWRKMKAGAAADVSKGCRAYYRYRRRPPAVPAMELGPFMAALRAGNQ